MNEAQLRGLDLEQLEAERFSHPNHYAMLKKHYDEVQRYRLQTEVAQLRQKLDEFSDTTKRNGEKIRKGKRIRTPLRDEADYVFTDIQLRIAEDILARHADSGIVRKHRKID